MAVWDRQPSQAWTCWHTQARVSSVHSPSGKVHALAITAAHSTASFAESSSHSRSLWSRSLHPSHRYRFYGTSLITNGSGALLPITGVNRVLALTDPPWQNLLAPWHYRHCRPGRLAVTMGSMSLELRPNCEYCDKDLPPQAIDAMICTYECTFCAACVDRISNVCPNCGGGFAPRPTRPTAEWRPGLSLAQRPASLTRVHLSYGKPDVDAFSSRIKEIPPGER